MEDAIRNAHYLTTQLLEERETKVEVEMEVRIKGPIVRRDTIARLLDRMSATDRVDYVELRNKSSTGTQANVYRCIDGGNVVCKSKAKTYKCPNEWASVVVSFEIDTESRGMLAQRHFVETNKTRYSKLMRRGVRLDVTHLHEDDTYQVEVEMMDGGQPQPLIDCVHQVIAILQDSPLYISRNKFETVRRIVGGSGYFSSTTASINAKGSITIDCSSNFSIFRGKYQKPVALTMRRIPIVLREGSYMTAKLDGARRFVVAFNGMVYDIEPEHLHVRLLRTNSPYEDPFPTIVDAELVDGTYHIFDICSFEGWYVGRERLSRRMTYAQQWVGTFANVIDCALKEYEKIRQDDPFAHIDEFHKRHLGGTFPIDGIIFTNEDVEYTDKVIKWKDCVTIDLMMGEDGELDERIVPNEIDANGVDVARYGTGVYEFEVLKVVDDEAEGPKLDLRLMRFRGDKKFPNHSTTIINNIEAFDVRRVWDGYGCLFMRRYHNAVKRDLLRNVCQKGCFVLDVGSGQGGDLSKWPKAKKVYCVEPNPNAVGELKKRLSKMDDPKKVTVLRCPISDTEKIRRRVKRVDVLALFFCANFFTRADLDGLEEIVAAYRPKHIVGTFLDAELIQYGSHPPCYEILPNGDKYQIRLFGTRIDQWEYRLGMDQLRLKGYEMVSSSPLNGDKSMSVNERELSQMFRVFHLRAR